MLKKNKTVKVKYKNYSVGGSTVRGTCGCGNLNAFKCLDNEGRKRYRASCVRCHKEGRRIKGNKCEICGFIPEDLVQLDLDHKDGDPSNNKPKNLQTICSNCHRLKTKLKMDWKPKK
jgi:hypothetical protein